MINTATCRVVCTLTLSLLCSEANSIEVFLPRTRTHIKCNFADGSFFEYKVREKWYFYLEIIPHVQTTADLDTKWRYVSPTHQVHNDIGTSDRNCRGVGKHEGRIFWTGGFEDVRHRMITFAFSPTNANELSNHLVPRPTEAPHLQSKLAELKSKEYVGSVQGPVVIALDARRLLLEQPLIATSRHRQFVSATVVYVLQSRSNDFGESWSTPILTTNADLYEIGRTLSDQSWAPEPEVIVEYSQRTR